MKPYFIEGAQTQFFGRIGGEVDQSSSDHKRINKILVQRQCKQTKKQFNELSMKTSAKTG